ncbi:MAG: hypothetical protein ACI91K_000778 [Flavobacteriales bacterium]|jgi:hypothetical protein
MVVFKDIKPSRLRKLRSLLQVYYVELNLKAASDAGVGEGVNLKVNDCLSEASCYERLKFTPEPKSQLRATVVKYGGF